MDGERGEITVSNRLGDMLIERNLCRSPTSDRRVYVTASEPGNDALSERAELLCPSNIASIMSILGYAYMSRPC